MENLSALGGGEGLITTSFAGSAFSGGGGGQPGFASVIPSGGGGGLLDFFNDPESLTIFAGGFKAASAIFSGFQEASLRQSNIDFLNSEIQLAEEAGALDRIRDRKKFRALEKDKRASISGLGASGFEDIFASDRESFELDQLISKFNQEVFIFGRLQSISNEKFRGNTAKLSGFTSAVGTGFETVSLLNPPTQSTVKKA